MNRLPIHIMLALTINASPPPTEASPATGSVRLDSGWVFAFSGDDSSGAVASATGFQNVVLPHTFPAATGFGAVPQGYGWYERDLQAPPVGPDSELFLCFDGVCLRASVHLGDSLIGRSPFPYLPFEVSLTGAAPANRPARLRIRVDNLLRPDDIPDPACKGWVLHGGLIRGVRLEVRPRNRLARCSVRTRFLRHDTFALDFSLRSAHGNFDSAEVRVVRHDSTLYRRFVVRPGDSTVLIGTVTPWTPASPYLYAIEVVPWFGGNPGTPRRISRGFCGLNAAGSTLFLNGKPFILRGVGRHDVLGEGGPVLTREQRRRDLLDIKQLGANFVRIAHFPQHRDVYELCDSIGLLVMDEIPAWKTDPRYLGSIAGRERASAYMREMIAQHGDHTCIGLWSVGNEFQSFRTAVADYVAHVSQEVKTADPSRLVTFCSYYYHFDRAFEHVDVISINEYFGWHLASLSLLAAMLDRIHREWPSKPVLISEFGAQAKHGLRNEKARLAGAVRSLYTKDLSEDHQALFLESHMDTILSRKPFLAGLVVWAYNDFLSTSRRPSTADMPPGLNSCGIVTRDRKRKLSYNTVKRKFALVK